MVGRALAAGERHPGAAEPRYRVRLGPRKVVQSEREAGHPAACSGRAHAPPQSKADAFLWQRASRFPRHGLRPEPFLARSSILSGGALLAYSLPLPRRPETKTRSR